MMRITPDILMLEYVAERLNRGVAIIRKNSLFAGSEPGGQRLAILYSFAAKPNPCCRPIGRRFPHNFSSSPGTLEDFDADM